MCLSDSKKEIHIFQIWIRILDYKTYFISELHKNVTLENIIHISNFNDKIKQKFYCIGDMIRGCKPLTSRPAIPSISTSEK